MLSILRKVIKKFGPRQQMIIAMEECAELTKEISKYLRGKPNPAALAEEIADVEIMCDQLKLIADNFYMVSAAKEKKLQRIADLTRELIDDRN